MGVPIAESVRVISLSDYSPPYTGSFVPMLLSLGRAVRGLGWSTDFVFPPSARSRAWLAEFEDVGLSYRFLDPPRTGVGRWVTWARESATSGRWTTSLAAALAALLAETEQPTILHTHFSAFDIAAAHAARYRPRTWVIWHEHALPKRGVRSAIGKRLWYGVFGRNVDRFVCVGPDVARSVGSLAGHDRVNLVPNGIDAWRFRLSTSRERLKARHRLGIASDAFVLLHFGAYWRIKGGDVFLDVATQMNAYAQNGLCALTVGLEEARLACRDSIVKVIAPRQDVQSLYAAADALVSTSRSEGTPFAVIEALATGLPVVVSDIPSHAFLRNVPSARVVPLESTAFLAAIRDIASRDGATRACDARAARTWVVESMGLDAWTRSVLEVYNQAIHLERHWERFTTTT